MGKVLVGFDLEANREQNQDDKIFHLHATQDVDVQTKACDTFRQDN